MAFQLNKPKQVSKWVKFEFGEDKHVSEFKIRGVKHKPYLIAHERIQNNFNVSGLKIENIDPGEFTFQEMLFKIASEYLIEDWKDVDVKVDGEIKSVAFDKDIAFDMMRFGGTDGVILWDFIVSNARKIQDEADAYKIEVLGKLNSSTNGANTEAKEKLVKPSKRKTPSLQPLESNKE